MATTRKLAPLPPEPPEKKPKRGGGRPTLPVQSKQHAITVTISYRAKQLLLRWAELLECHRGTIIERLIMNAYHAELAKQTQAKAVMKSPTATIAIGTPSESRTLVPTRVLKSAKRISP